MGPFDAEPFAARPAGAAADRPRLMSSAGGGQGRAWRVGGQDPPPLRPHPHPNQIIGTIAGLERLRVLGPGRPLHQGRRAGQPEVPQELCAALLLPPARLFRGIGVAPC